MWFQWSISEIRNIVIWVTQCLDVQPWAKFYSKYPPLLPSGKSAMHHHCWIDQFLTAFILCLSSSLTESSAKQNQVISWGHRWCLNSCVNLAAGETGWGQKIRIQKPPMYFQLGHQPECNLVPPPVSSSHIFSPAPFWGHEGCIFYIYLQWVPQWLFGGNMINKCTTEVCCVLTKCKQIKLIWGGGGGEAGKIIRSFTWPFLEDRWHRWEAKHIHDSLSRILIQTQQ